MKTFTFLLLSTLLNVSTASAINYDCSAEHPECPLGRVCDTEARMCLAPEKYDYLATCIPEGTRVSDFPDLALVVNSRNELYVSFTGGLIPTETKYEKVINGKAGSLIVTNQSPLRIVLTEPTLGARFRCDIGE